MKRRTWLHAVALGLVLVVGSLGPGLPTYAATSSAKAADYLFAFKDAELSQVAEQILGRTLGVNYLVDPSLNVRLSFRIEQRLTQPQLIEAFEAVLAANDIAMVREGDTLMLKPRGKAKVGAPLRVPGEAPHRAGYEVVAVPLNFASAAEVAKALESIAPPNTVLYANDKTGLLLLGGSGAELQSALQSVKVFDQDGLAESKIRWFEIREAPVTTVADDLKRLLDGASVQGVSIIPLKRLNGLFVFARSEEALKQVEKWIARLDTPSQDKSSSFWVYHPRNVSAEDLAGSLGSLMGDRNSQGLSPSPQSSSGFSIGKNGVAGGQSTASGPAVSPALASASFSSPSGGEGSVRVSVDRNTNSLLIAAPGADWSAIRKILEELDRAPAQILIEASILEVTLTDDFKFGVDWSVFSGNGRFNIASTTNAAGAVAAQAPGLAVTFIDKDIKAAINALGSKTTVEVVSAPKIMALDNHPARLEVGDQVPIIVQTQQSTTSANAALVNSVDYRNTGVILNVTPRIAGDDRIALSITQEVSSVAPTTTSGIDSPTIQQRKFDSALLLGDGGTVALGGLISSTRTKGGTGVPYLQKIPFAGALFDRHTDSLQKTELIILLSARIIRDQAATNRVMADLLADMNDASMRGLVNARR